MDTDQLAVAVQAVTNKNGSIKEQQQSKVPTQEVIQLLIKADLRSDAFTNILEWHLIETVVCNRHKKDDIFAKSSEKLV